VGIHRSTPSLPMVADMELGQLRKLVEAAGAAVEAYLTHLAGLVVKVTLGAGVGLAVVEAAAVRLAAVRMVMLVLAVMAATESHRPLAAHQLLMQVGVEAPDRYRMDLTGQAGAVLQTQEGVGKVQTWGGNPVGLASSSFVIQIHTMMRKQLPDLLRSLTLVVTRFTNSQVQEQSHSKVTA